MSVDALELIQTAVNEERWEMAYSLLADFKELHPDDYATDIFAVLEGSVSIWQKDYSKALDCIAYGLKYNIYNYELYFMLGKIKDFRQHAIKAFF